MCTSQAEGGQRCFSNTSKALAAASVKKASTEAAYLSAVAEDGSEPKRELRLRRGLAAEAAYEDALSQYASTTKGRDDLLARLVDAPRYHQANKPATGDDWHTLNFAIQEGQSLRERAAETKRAVRAGEMSQETALARTEFPNDFARSHRAASDNRTVARIMARPLPDAAPVGDLAAHTAMLTPGHYDTGNATQIEFCEHCEADTGHAPHNEPWRTMGTGSDLYCIACNDKKVDAL